MSMTVALCIVGPICDEIGVGPPSRSCTRHQRSGTSTASTSTLISMTCGTAANATTSRPTWTNVVDRRQDTGPDSCWPTPGYRYRNETTARPKTITAQRNSACASRQPAGTARSLRRARRRVCSRPREDVRRGRTRAARAAGRSDRWATRSPRPRCGIPAGAGG
jgi:hypothetical protein